MNGNNQEQRWAIDEFLAVIEILEDIEVNENNLARNEASVNMPDGSPLLF